MAEEIDGAAELAKERASKNAEVVQQGVKQIPKSDGVNLTTREDLMQLYKTCIVQTSSGRTFEVRNVAPGDFMVFFGSPILQALSAAGVDLEKANEVPKVVEKLSQGEALKIVTEGSLVELARHVVCIGVLSLNFVVKPQAECDDGKQETSVFLLPLNDTIELYTAIVKFSVSEEDTGLVQLFREESEEEQRRSDTDTSDGESV